MAASTDQFASESFWQDLLSRPEAQAALKVEQEAEARRAVKRMQKECLRENEDLKNEVKGCSRALQKCLAPIIHLPMAHRLLHNALKESRARSMSFEDYLDSQPELMARMRQVCEEFKADPAGVGQLQERWAELVHEAQTSQPNATHHAPDALSGMNARSIAAVKCKRRGVDSFALKTVLTAATQCRKTGNEYFEAGNYTKALDVFSNAVSMLGPVTGTNPEDARYADEMLLVVLKNQAAAALKCERWILVIDACSRALELDASDAKSLYRRGNAFLALGDLEKAKEDFGRLREVAWGDAGNRKLAASGLASVAAAAKKNKSTFSSFWAKAEGVLSDGRGEKEPSQGKESAAGDSITSVESDTKASSSELLSLEDTKRILESLRHLYTGTELQKQLGEEAERAVARDETEALFLQRLKKVLPPIGLEAYPFLPQTDEMQKCDIRSLLDKSMAFWAERDGDVNFLSQAVWSLLMQEFAMKQRAKHSAGWEDY